jgi:hypothetical protein
MMATSIVVLLKINSDELYREGVAQPLFKKRMVTREPLEAAEIYGMRAL